MSAEIFPDSCLRDKNRGLVFTQTEFGTMRPIFCASCHRQGGLVSVTSTHAFWQCNDCFLKYGVTTGYMVVPDHEYWEKIKAEMLEAHGRLLAGDELAKIVEDGDTPLAKLILSGAPTSKGQ